MKYHNVSNLASAKYPKREITNKKPMLVADTISKEGQLSITYVDKNRAM
jgi:hypothetical protein